MIIKNVKLVNFRNYKSFEFNFNKNYNIIYGNNGQGKTNILESLFLCATGRSHRTSKDNELVKFGEEGFCVKLEIINKNLEKIIEFKFFQNKKFVYVNEIKLTKIGELIGILNVVLFAPEDILIIKEGPKERRRFLDIAISQIKPSYFYDLQLYKKVLLNRNILLKNFKDHNKIENNLKENLEIWDSQLVKIGSRIIYTRFKFINKLELIIKPRHSYMTDSKEDISVKYKTFFNIENNELNEIEKVFSEKLNSNLKSDIFRNNTSVGPHRDDFEIFINDINIKNYGSQGQQRTAILSLKLAEVDILKEMTGEEPIMLLDDFASELDELRGKRFLESLKNVQVVITSTNKDVITKIKDIDVSYLYIKNSDIYKNEVLE